MPERGAGASIPFPALPNKERGSRDRPQGDDRSRTSRPRIPNRRSGAARGSRSGLHDNKSTKGTKKRAGVSRLISAQPRPSARGGREGHVTMDRASGQCSRARPPEATLAGARPPQPLQWAFRCSARAFIPGRRVVARSYASNRVGWDAAGRCHLPYRSLNPQPSTLNQQPGCRRGRCS
jgi:hypothetical protein